MRSTCMKSLSLIALPLLALPLLATCGTAGEMPPRSERAQTRLTEALAGKVAGPPQRCLPRYRSADQQIVDRGTILYRQGRDIVYRNDPAGGCNGLDSTRTLLTITLNGDLCRGDIIRVLDQSSGAVVGSCEFGDFIPYAVPGSRYDRSGS